MIIGSKKVLIAFVIPVPPGAPEQAFARLGGKFSVPIELLGMLNGMDMFSIIGDINDIDQRVAVITNTPNPNTGGIVAP